MPTQILLEQGSQEWLSFRKNKIGGSDAAKILGVSPWSTTLKLWREKLDLEQVRFVSAAMKRGTELEEEAREWVNNKTGHAFKPAVFVSNERSYMMTSLDGYDESNGHILEIKCPGEKDHDTARKGKVPEHYMPQLQHAMYVMEMDKCLYCSYDGQDAILIDVKRDEEYITKLLIAEEEFYKCMIQRVPPPSKEDHIIEMENIEWATLMAQYQADMDVIKMLTLRTEETKKKLIELTGQSNAKGMGYTLQQVTRKGSVDYDKIYADYNVDVEKYRKQETTYWKIGKYNE